MNTQRLALLLLLGAAAMVATTAFAQEQDLVPSKLPTTPMMREALISRAQKLGTSAARNDTVWFGHSHANHFNSASNWWNLYTGVNFGGISSATTARWDFDNYTGIPVGSEPVDSLQGWWSTRARYTGALATMTDDKVRTWGALDAGNEANQVQPGRVRNKGVVGVWHADPGNGAVGADGTNPGNPYIWWSALAGSKSAWCGLRALHDVTVIDPITKNPFNQSVMELYDRIRATAAYGTLRNYPGYAAQWDQMLYRDLVPTDHQAFSIRFLYKTRMSETVDVTPTGRCGWFWGDPLKTATLNDGNFISAADAGAGAPADSFMVYAGVPTDDANAIFSNGTFGPVYDPQRRWFSEVLALYPDLWNQYPTPPLYELTSAAGLNPADTLGAAIPYTGTLSAAQVHAIVSYPSNVGHRLRLVFRVKTNRAHDDGDFAGTRIGGGTVNGNLFSSLGRGAAMVDDVQVDPLGLASNWTMIGDFEGPEGGIDNAADVDATVAWKSTGKPGGNCYHAADIQTVPWNELCGRPNTSTSHCDMAGVVADAGNADDGESMGDSRYSSMKEVEAGIMSPTIDMTPTNTMGLTPTMVDPTDDYYLAFDVYTGALFGSLGTGCLYLPCSQWYPVRQVNGVDVWSDRIQPPFNLYNDAKQCYFENDTPLLANGCRKTTSASGVPDSMRVYVGILQQCFAYGASVTCNSRDGAYFDNISVAFVNTGAGVLGGGGPIASDPWQWFQDAFTVNGADGNANVPGSGTAFDTTTALVKGAINIAPMTGMRTRFDVLADTVVVSACDGTRATPGDTTSTHMRVDLVFRILPGPGNYNTTGRAFPPISSMALLKRPTNQASGISVPPAADDHSFWAEYIREPGAFSKGTHHGHQWWDYLTWNSARCDTAEYNVFPFVARGKYGTTVTTGLAGGVYASMLHEEDPKFAVLGIDKFKCFLIDTTQAFAVTPALDNVSCDGAVPAWVTALQGVSPGDGYDGNATTKEFTKIIPDGLLTPGSHVQYFWRKQPAFGLGVALLDPDTLQIMPQRAEGSLDAHRWQNFSVLPDGWKQSPWGYGLACALYVDYDDRRGDETVWISTMDSIRGTMSTRWGAHNGWHAVGGTDLDITTNPGGIASAYVYGRNSQPGTGFDCYNFKGSESGPSCGGRLGNRLPVADPTGAGKLAGKFATSGPTPQMLALYKVVALLTGDLATTLLGPATNIGEQDTLLFERFIANATNKPRALWFQGQDFASEERGRNATFLADRLGVVWRDNSYQSLSQNSASCADLLTFNPITTPNQVYGTLSSCSSTADVLNLNPGVSEAVMVSQYEAIGVNAPYYASIYKPSVAGGREWIALTNGWDIRRQWSRYCNSDYGRLLYNYNAIVGALSRTNCEILTPCWGWCGDVPSDGLLGPFANFMRIGNSLVRTGNATVRFGVSKSDRIRVRLYDVSGRLVRTLADRMFAAGDDHVLTWDGADDTGHQAPRGVYFARIDYATAGAPITGRMVMLR